VIEDEDDEEPYNSKRDGHANRDHDWLHVQKVVGFKSLSPSLAPKAVRAQWSILVARSRYSDWLTPLIRIAHELRRQSTREAM